jgi:hypothetical protein
MPRVGLGRRVECNSSRQRVAAKCPRNAGSGLAFGQYCIVMPDQDVVVAITSGIKDMQAALNVVWDKLLPALQPRALPPNDDAHQQLMNKLARLEVRPAQGAATSPLASQVLNRKFVFPVNDQKVESLLLSSSDSGKTVTLTTRIDGKNAAVVCGYPEWKQGQGPLMAGA